MKFEMRFTEHCRLHTGIAALQIILSSWTTRDVCRPHLLASMTGATIYRNLSVVVPGSVKKKVSHIQIYLLNTDVLLSWHIHLHNLSDGHFPYTLTSYGVTK